MKKERLQLLKFITMWGGVLVTLSGIFLNLVNGGNWQGNGLALLGLFITCCGHLIGTALDRHKAAERLADENRILELSERIKSAEEAIGDDDGALGRIIQKQKSEDFMRAFNGDDWK